MTLLAVLRHAPTSWNHNKRLQGRADIAITEEARARMARRFVPSPYADWRALASPLGRCLQTASALRLVVASEERLIEMDWGEYQGSTIDELRLREGDAFDANEHRGLDFRPPGGESPRDVQARLAPLLARLAAEAKPTLAVTHRGVIRALYATAAGWDMTGDPPHKLDLYDTLQVFALAQDGSPSIARLNLALGWRSRSGEP